MTKLKTRKERRANMAEAAANIKTHSKRNPEKAFVARLIGDKLVVMPADHPMAKGS